MRRALTVGILIGLALATWAVFDMFHTRVNTGPRLVDALWFIGSLAAVTALVILYPSRRGPK